MATRTGQQSLGRPDNPVPGIPYSNRPLDPEGGRVVDVDADPAEVAGVEAKPVKKAAVKKAAAKKAAPAKRAAAKKATAKKATAKKATARKR